MKRLFLALLLPGLAMAAEPSPAVTQEIAHLFSHLKSSDCQFNRNGSWYSTADAAAHLEKKYAYLLRKDLVSSSEDFIQRAATESSMSGKPYLVKCGAGKAVQSGPWFKAELKKYRAERGIDKAVDKP